MIALRTILIVFFAIFALTACVTKGKYVELEGNLTATQEEVEAKNREIQDLEERREALEYQTAEMENQLREKKLTIDEMENQLQETKMVIEQMESQLKIKKMAIDDMEKQLQEKEGIIDEMASTRRNIETSLQDQIASKQVKLEMLEGKLKITFIDKILFNSGSAKVNRAGQQTLSNLAHTLKQQPDQKIVVEGHTDDVKVGRSLRKVFPTNWELSTARATAVVRYLQEEAAIEPKRLSAVGYSFYKPVADNEDEEGRAQNRRIEIILVPPR